MNEQPLNPNQVPVTPPPVPQPIRPKISDLVKEVFKKFYEKNSVSGNGKKIFRLVVAIFGVLILVIVAGLIFSASKNGGEIKLFSPPTPEATIVPGKESEDENITKLKGLKEKIFNLDIYQKRLSPPSVNFTISF